MFHSGVKMVNQLLAGVHIASAAEAMAFGARLGLNTRKLFNVISNSGGTSWYALRRFFWNKFFFLSLENSVLPSTALTFLMKSASL